MNSKKIKSLLIQRQGFTLIELIAVIAVIGVLAAAAVPAIGNINERAQVTQVTKDITVVSDAVAAYIQETGAVPVVNAANTANSIQMKNPEGGTPLSPGISVNKFKRAAAPGKFYVIDMALLTNKQVNIENPVDIVAPKLNSIPTSSVFSDIEDNDTVTSILTRTNKSVKNTSVIYVIDKEQRVYAINPRNLSKMDLEGKNALPAVATGSIEYHLLKPSEEQYAAAQKAAATNVGDAHEVFNVPFMKVSNADILLSLSVSDKSYKNF